MKIPEATYNRLVWYLHVPLDSYSIQAVRNCIDARLKEQIGHIPSSAGMGFVKTREVYDGLQKTIRLLAEKEEIRKGNCACPGSRGQPRGVGLQGGPGDPSRYVLPW